MEQYGHSHQLRQAKVCNHKKINILHPVLYISHYLHTLSMPDTRITEQRKRFVEAL